MDVAAGRIEDETYLVQMKALRASAHRIDGGGSSEGVVTPTTRAVWYLNELGRLWRRATPQERAELIASIYASVTVAGPEFVEIDLTPAAYANGLALALPERIPCSELARPTGVGRAGAHSGFKQILIEGADEWRSAARESA